MWGEGNPYALGPDGKRHYYYHPSDEDTIEFVARLWPETKGLTDSELMEFMRPQLGNEPDAYCKKCDQIFHVAQKGRTPACPECGSKQTILALNIPEKVCPKCKKGRFPKYGERTAIS